MKPIFKWLGRKDGLAPHILALFPVLTQETTYYEPFLGSGAIAGILAEKYTMNYVLNEGNPDLYWVFMHLGSQYEALLYYTRNFYDAGPDAYYIYRDWFNTSLKPGDVRRSALFIYFNRFGYNGLCRYNLEGGFNTPRGKHKTIYFPADELKAWSTWLKTYPHVMVTNRDFAQSIFPAGRGDVVYMDPPYYPLTPTSSFTSYGAALWFNEADHIRLNNEALAAARQGATVIVSNNDVPFIREMYSKGGAEIITLPPIRRSVSCGERALVAEILAVWR